MIQDQYSEILTRADDSRGTARLPVGGLAARRGLRFLGLGLALALVLSGLEAVLWLANPGGLFGAGAAVRTPADVLALPLHMPLLLLLPALEVALGTWLAWGLARPLALRAYLRAVFRAQEAYRARNTPLQSWSYPYDVPLSYTLDHPDPVQPRQTRVLTQLELIEMLLAATSGHQLLLGAPGAGKTLFAHEYLSALAQRPRQVAWGRLSVPLYLPLKAYALLLQTSDLEDTDFSLLAFLDACDPPGLEHLRPHLGRLLRQGRLLFLCDGLDEVPAIYRSALDGALIGLLRQGHNRLLLTCTPEIYEQSAELVQAVGENLVPLATFAPLAEPQTRRMVERFITELDTSYHPNLPTAGQVMSALEQTRLGTFCTTPLYLFSLLTCLESRPISEIRGLDTRGRLLQAFVLARLHAAAQTNTQAPDVSDALLFLRTLACVARSRGDSDQLLLPAECVQILETSEHAASHEHSLEAVLVDWARQQQAYSPFAEEALFSLAEALPANQACALLEYTCHAGLIDVDRQGVLSFRHTLVVSALLAEYLALQYPQADQKNSENLMLPHAPAHSNYSSGKTPHESSNFAPGSMSLNLDEIEILPDDLALWSEPLALWAGLLADPLQAAEALADYAHQHPDQRIRALVVSLICLGVGQIPPGLDTFQAPQIPPTLALVLGEILDDQPALVELAALVQDCADPPAGACDVF